MIGVGVMAKGKLTHDVEMIKLSINTAAYFNLEIHNKLQSHKIGKEYGRSYLWDTVW
jgi:hypothetical protein